MNCAVFASGGGSNFQSLLDKKNEGKLSIDFTLMVGNNSSAKAFERARIAGIPAVHCAPSRFESPDAYSAFLLDLLTEHRVECISLAGYMKMVPPAIINAYRNRIINIHPALLPAFGGAGMYGSRVHEAVIAWGAKVSGITVHFADEQYDNGPVILQETVPVLDTDDAVSLAARVLKVEHAHYWRALEALARGNLRVEGRRVTGALPAA